MAPRRVKIDYTPKPFQELVAQYGEQGVADLANGTLARKERLQAYTQLPEVRTALQQRQERMRKEYAEFREWQEWKEKQTPQLQSPQLPAAAPQPSPAPPRFRRTR